MDAGTLSLTVRCNRLLGDANAVELRDLPLKPITEVLEPSDTDPPIVVRRRITLV